jgi:hypothetical protein
MSNLSAVAIGPPETPEVPPPAILFEDVAIGFDLNSVLNGVSFAVQHGQT